MKRMAGLTAFVICAIVLASAGRAGTFDLKLTVDVPPGVEPTAKNVKLAPLPAGKKLAVVLYVDWSYRSAKTALPLAKSFSKAGWRATFFLAGAKDVAQYAPKLEALGHEIGTNLYSGGISAYRDEMVSYTPQDILNAIGPLKSELNAVLKRPVITQLVRGHGVPYRDRLQAMGYLQATHWYTHYVLLGRDAPREVSLGGYSKGAIPIVRVGKLDEAAFTQAAEKKARAVILGRGWGPNPAPHEAFLKTHGGKKDYWYATLGEYASTVYLQRKMKVSGVKVADGKAVVTLAVADDFGPLFLRAPVSLDLAGKVVDVPASDVLGGPVKARLTVSLRRIRLPGQARLMVSLTGPDGKPRLMPQVSVTAPDGFDVKVVPADTKFGRKLFSVRSNAKAGPLSFGFVPLVARIEYKVGETTRTLLAATELEVRPALAVDVYPYYGVPLAPKGSQTFMLTIDNLRAGPGRGNWRKMRPKFDKFILPPEGPVKATITFPESKTFKVAPEKLDLELAAAGQRKVFYVKVTNTAPDKKPYVFWPQIRLAGEDKPLLLPFGGTNVHCVAKLGAAPLDDKGLLMYASWDKLDGGSSPGVDKARGKKASYQGAMGPGRIGPGLLGKALLHNSVCLLDAFANFDEAEGTMMFWLRNDPGQKRPFPRGRTERLFAVETQHPPRNVNTSLLSLGLRDGRELTVRMMTLGPIYHYLKAKFPKTDEWRHVALTWSCSKKSIRIIVDGEVAGELTDDGKSWHSVPARRWPYHYGNFMTPLSNDHNAYTSTMRDEFYIYNRPLSAEEIQEHIKQVKTKAEKAD